MGNDIGERAFTKWLAAQKAVPPADRNAERIAKALWPLVELGTLGLPRGGNIVRRGRDRIVVEPAGS